MKRLTTTEAGAIIGVTAQSIRNYIARKRPKKKLKATWSGRHWLIKREDLEAFDAIPRPGGRPPKTGK